MLEKRSYHGGKDRDAIDQAGGVQPRLCTQNAVEINKCKRPLKEELKPNNSNEETRLLGNKIITILLGIPIFEVDQKVWEETSR